MGACASKCTRKEKASEKAGPAPEQHVSRGLPAAGATSRGVGGGDNFAVDVPLSAALAEILRLDENGLAPGNDYELDIQDATTTGNKGKVDYAPRPLFKRVKADVLQRPTYKTFLALLDNYVRHVGDLEDRTPEEMKEERAFLDAIVGTSPMRYAHAYLVHRNLAPSDGKAWKDMLQTLWFKLYVSQNGGVEDSCGFEHVFVGEEKTKGKNKKTSQLTGFHNWVQLWQEEAAGRMNYIGWVTKDNKPPAATTRVMSLQFNATDRTDKTTSCKNLSTSFVGVSPEFEIALFTVAGLAAGGAPGDKNVSHVRVDAYDVELTTIVWAEGKDKLMRTCYPALP